MGMSGFGEVGAVEERGERKGRATKGSFFLSWQVVGGLRRYWEVGEEEGAGFRRMSEEP